MGAKRTRCSCSQAVQLSTTETLEHRRSTNVDCSGLWISFPLPMRQAVTVRTSGAVEADHSPTCTGHKLSLASQPTASRPLLRFNSHSSRRWLGAGGVYRSRPQLQPAILQGHFELGDITLALAQKLTKGWNGMRSRNAPSTKTLPGADRRELKFFSCHRAGFHTESGFWKK